MKISLTLFLLAISFEGSSKYLNTIYLQQVRGTVEQPIVDGSASFHRASVFSPVLRKPLTNFGGTVHVVSNRLSITSIESRVSRKGKLLLKGNLPLRSSESSINDKIDLKCEVLEVRAKNIFRSMPFLARLVFFFSIGNYALEIFSVFHYFLFLFVYLCSFCLFLG